MPREAELEPPAAKLQPLVAGSRPDPDPTLRTMELVEKAIHQLEGKLDIRISAIEESIKLQHDDMVRVPTEVMKATGALRELLEAKHVTIEQRMETLAAVIRGEVQQISAEMKAVFEGITARFHERDVRMDTQAADNRRAVDAAFESTAEATRKLETTFTKQVDTQQEIVGAKTTSLERSLGDLKDRVTAMEARGGGQAAMWGWVVGGIGLIGMIVMVIFVVLTFSMRAKEYTGTTRGAAVVQLPGIAHDHGQFGQYSAARDQWLKQQKHPKTGVSCCNESDSDLVQEDIREGHYWIKWNQFDWTHVPDDKVLPYPNPTGQPVVWWSPMRGLDGKVTPAIRCYAPGALL